jgi:two-component system, NtrC family, sensor kinase
MSDPNSPDASAEVARLQALVSAYEARLSDAAELVARVRHEINNPLAALLGQAQLLLREELPERPRRRAETIENQAKRIEEIVGELRGVQMPTAPSSREDA